MSETLDILAETIQKINADHQGNNINLHIKIIQKTAKRIINEANKTYGQHQNKVIEYFQNSSGEETNNLLSFLKENLSKNQAILQRLELQFDVNFKNQAQVSDKFLLPSKIPQSINI